MLPLIIQGKIKARIYCQIFEKEKLYNYFNHE